jgi:hypothetical protein
MLKNTNMDSSCYYPICREIGCNGILEINFNEDFTINCKCEYNENHFYRNVLLKIFDIYYLKKKEIQKCSNCKKNIENSNKYKCLQCKNIYCNECFHFDKHLKNDKNNLMVITGKCQFHNPNELMYFCYDCKKTLCYDCINNTQNSPHKNHKIKCVIDAMLPNNRIKSLNNKIKQKKLIYQKLVNSINKWQEELLKKIDRLKNNLNEEINLLEKMISNYNPYFVNNTYHENYNYLHNYIKNINNKDLMNFINEYKFEEQAKYLLKLLNRSNKTKKHFKKINCNLEFKDFCENDGIIKLNSNLFFNYFDEDFDKTVMQVNEYQNGNFSFGEKFVFHEPIHSFSFSIDKTKIYACLLNKKTIKIFNVNLNNKTIITNEKEINEHKNHKHFNKCIQISEQCLATADGNFIKIWKENKNEKSYIKEKEINISGANDLLLVNNDSFISAVPFNSKIIFFDIANLEQSKNSCTVNFSINSNECLYLIKDYVIIRGREGIGLLYIKTKEYVQYIEGFDNNFSICLDEFDNIYISQYNNESEKLSVMKLKMIDGICDKSKEYIVSKEENKEDFLFDDNYFDIYQFEILCMNKKDIIFFMGDKIFALKKKNENIY